MATAVGYAIGYVLLRHLRDESAALQNASVGLGSAAALVAVSAASQDGLALGADHSVWSNERQLIALLVVLTVGSAAQYFLTCACQFEQAGVVAVVDASESVFAFLWVSCC